MNIIGYFITFIALFTAAVLAAPMPAPGPYWWNVFNGPEVSQRPQNERTGRSGKDRYKALCKVINPDPYAFPGKIPYPAAPLCPY